MSDDADIRPTGPDDWPHLVALYRAAFPHENLIPLLKRLLAEVPDALSLLASGPEGCRGHILFTPCDVTSGVQRVALLGPLAVAPRCQRQGIGGALVREGLARLEKSDVREVLVLGDPAYYGRFGFRPERAIAPPYDLPAAWADAWQSLSLDDRAAAPPGVLRPPAAWMSPSLWSP